jgi:hypothetical protein
VAAPVQVLPYRLGLFRAKLLVQIFPETVQDFFTFHPFEPPPDASTPCWTLPPEQRRGPLGS